ncbi:cell death abnormality protein 1 isoform X3 [Schistocerca gregaria]|uniref:cell death abnormality protein 1 isoform X3 n=1 Tax=Schistocerca gregaria TaxID=7010 RepID=UPI00211E27C3|nr:cell death abnormality protein 1 isoform X3 [Schistocerca gregaria]
MGGRRPAPNRRYGSHASRWLTLHGPLWLTAMVAAALVGHVAGAEVSVSTAAENGAEAATQAAVQHRLGDECGEDLPAGAECVGVPGAFCRPEDGRCACREGRVAAADDRDRCELPARLGEECHFDEQCGVATPRTVCVQGRCRCSEGLVAVNVSVEEAGGGGTGGGGDVGGEGGGDGGGGPHAACIEPGRRRLGEPCKDRKECGAPNSFCLPGKDVCACLPEFPLTDGHSQCGKPAAWNDSCDFSEQCLATTDKTVCRAGRCVCMYQMRAERQADGSTKCLGGELKYGDRCDDSSQCGFDHGVCEKQSGKQLCLCQPDYPVTNHINMCGKPAKINETCEFSEQCERTTEKTECRDGRCVCLFQMGALYKNDGSVECVDIKQEPPSLQYVDPTMIGVLVGLGLMFIILCVVLHLFSKARWRENRTIFNTPNPRLMNVSLLRDSKLIHGVAGKV